MDIAIFHMHRDLHLVFKNLKGSDGLFVFWGVLVLNKNHQANITSSVTYST